MKRFIALLLTMCMLLGLPCMAAENDIDSMMDKFIEEHGLNENNFAMGWMDLLSGETWFYGEENFMVAGSMYKVPLAMAVYDRIETGELSFDDVTRNFTIKKALEKSIVNSDNDAAQALRYAISNDNNVYRAALAAYSGYESADLPQEYYLDNEISPRFIINTLKYLYEHQDKYSELIGNMRLAHPDRYFKMDNAHLDIAHKYGSFEGAANDCAIVFASRPFALVVFTQNVSAHKQIMSEICSMMAQYSEGGDSIAFPEDGGERIVRLLTTVVSRLREKLGC